ncbi:MAG: phenylalanine--tRNA ligase subunit beta [Dissulfurimicrobium sp.]|uniref:phenylalanine--tRNA ligase subunit beta n=1 Tax=Dissulfurimicrobium TaxID=1769732 RepID=UPI003C778876
MRILTSWLKEFVPFDCGVERLGRDLTLTGLEIESIEPFGPDDFVIDISITPNRPDCLSVLGIAREISAIYGLPLIFGPSVCLTDGAPGALETSVSVPVTIEAVDHCARYAACVLEDVRIGPSPDWLKRRLEACGIRPVNNVVDATNYVLLELGQPLHAFDLDRLRGPAIVVRSARAGEAIKTLDGKDRPLSAGMLVIADEERPVAVAGIMGGAETEVRPETSRILLESAWFEPSQVRRTAKALKIYTEASYRFERGTDIEGVMTALKRAVDLISDLASPSGSPVKAGGVRDVYPRPFEARVIRIRPERVKRLLGVEIEAEHIAAILESLGLARIDGMKDVSAMGFSVPSYRLDLIEETDLIEEVARLYGYDNIEAEVPCAGIIACSPATSPEKDLIDKAKEILVSQGMCEAISYSFISPGDIERLGLEGGDPRLRPVRLQNPISEDLSVMRTSLIPSLLGAAARNQARRNMDVKLFEAGAVFYHGTGQDVLSRQEQRVAAVWVGARHCPSWAWGRERADVFDLKGIMEELLRGLMINGWSLILGTPGDPFYLAGASARVVDSNGGLLGTFGEISPKVLAAWDIDGPLFAFDLSLEAMGRATSPGVRFKPLPRFPSMERDVALVMPDHVVLKDILEFVQGNRPMFLEDIEVFDVYTGSPIPKGSKGIGLRLRYRAEDRTLSEEEVSRVNGGFVEALLKRFGGALRG